MANHPDTELCYVDLGKSGGLAGKKYVFMHIRDYLDDLGYDITMATADFPRYVAYLQGKGFSDPQILDMNLFTCEYNERVLDAMEIGGGLSMVYVKLPPGLWWMTSELLAPMGTIEGSGSSWYFGSGGCELRKDPDQFQSVLEEFEENEGHGFISTNLYGTNWYHGVKIRNLHLTGDGGDYNDSTRKSNGIMIQSPGETAVIEDCFIEQWNDFGVAFFKSVAPARVVRCSFFYMGDSGVGCLDTALGVISVDQCSGDQNVSHVKMCHWDHAENPDLSIGGELTIISPKIEAYPEDIGLAVYGSPGKGQMLFWFEGFDAPGTNTLFKVVVLGGQSYCNGGYMESLMRVHQYNPGTTHQIQCIGHNVHRYLYLLTDTVAGEKYGDTEIGWFTQGSGPFTGQFRFPEYTYLVPQFNWNSVDEEVVKLGRSADPTVITAVTATGLRLHGPQNQDPASSFLPTASKWDPNDNDAVPGIDPLTGVAYP